MLIFFKKDLHIICEIKNFFFIRGFNAPHLTNLYIKISKNDIPVATQIFTPSWIVKYMVENTLGRFVDFQDELTYYIPCQHNDILEDKDLEEIKLIDPCCGTGHLLVYAFDLFLKQYILNGYAKEDAVKNILTRNNT